MTNLMKEQVQKAIPVYLKAKGITANDLAVKVGVSAATISNMRTGNWNSIDGRLWRRVWQVVNAEAADGVFQTADCKSVFELCDRARKNKFMAGLTGDTGMGKTTACKAYGLRPNVFYYYVDRSVTPKVFFEQIMQEMSINFFSSMNDMLNRVAHELNSLDSPLLIVDESGKLSDKMIMALHSLRDKTMQNCGIVLAGMPGFKNDLIKKVNRDVPGYAEFYRRINLWHDLKGLTRDEIKHILESNGITDKDKQTEYRKLTRFGDLMNEIILEKSLNN